MLQRLKLWILQWLRPQRTASARPPRWPSKEKIERLPPFEGLSLEHIVVVGTAAAAHRARSDLLTKPVVGFDTESRPTFRKGYLSNGPHIVQFSTLERAYIFHLHDRTCRHVAGALIADARIKKVGFGLSEDLRSIRQKLGAEPREVHDLQDLFVQKKYGSGVGAKVGVAIALKRCFAKSKKTATSNWAQRALNERQLLYAANDAYAALRVHQALTRA